MESTDRIELAAEKIFHFLSNRGIKVICAGISLDEKDSLVIEATLHTSEEGKNNDLPENIEGFVIAYMYGEYPTSTLL